MIDKKKKAAIAAVIAYLEKTEGKEKVNKWVRLGRIIIMNNNQMVQTKKLKHGGI